MTDTIDIVKDSLRREAEAVASIPLDNPYDAVTETIHRRCRLGRGKLVVTGVGKAGSVASELGTTFSSTGTPAVFLHPLEAVHGDLGIIQPDDALLLVSNSGETREIVELVPRCRGLVPDMPIICITGRAGSSLARLSDHVLLTGSPSEICPLGMTPTVSTTVMGVIGDILVVLQMRRIGFTDAEYLARHHGGYLGSVARARVAPADLPGLPRAGRGPSVRTTPTRKAAMSALEASAATESDRDLYLHGSCHAFAVALHRRHGMRILVVCDPDRPYWTDDADPDNSIPSVVHCYGFDGDGRAWDVLGARPAERVADEIKERHPDVEAVDQDVLAGEAGLALYVDGMAGDEADRPLHGLSEADLAEAADCAARVLAPLADLLTPSPTRPEPASPTYFHGGAPGIAEGAVLAARPDGYAATVDPGLEALMERFRPREAIPRKEAVFLCASPDDVDAAGGDTDEIYAVAADGPVTRHDLAWYSRAQAAMGDGDGDEAERCARAYWSGRGYDDPACSLFEYLTRSARVIAPVPGAPAP